VPTLPGLRQGPDLNHQLHIFAGHISSDPDAKKAGPTDVTAHLFFTLVKARRSGDKERIMFWFNVRLTAPIGFRLLNSFYSRVVRDARHLMVWWWKLAHLDLMKEENQEQ
jgi:hypothetical protein